MYLSISENPLNGFTVISTGKCNNIQEFSDVYTAKYDIINCTIEKTVHIVFRRQLRGNKRRIGKEEREEGGREEQRRKEGGREGRREGGREGRREGGRGLLTLQTAVKCSLNVAK